MDHKHNNSGHKDHHGNHNHHIDHEHKDHHDHHSEHNHHEHHKHMIEDFKKRFYISIILTIPIMVLAPMIQSLLGFEFTFEGAGIVRMILSSVIFVYGGYPFLKGLLDEVKQKQPGMMTLIALAISVAYFYSMAVALGLSGKIFFWELASLIDIMLLGHWIEMKSVMKASSALKELTKLLPDTARKFINDNDTKEVPVSELQPKDIILIKPGEKIPADGIVISGESRVNESLITGESKPAKKSSGDEIIGGSINEKGSLKVEIKQSGNNTYLSKVIDMVKNAQQSKSKTQNLANRAAGWLFYLAISAGIITLISWLSVGKDLNYSLERMVTVMVISCPHALGLAIPLVVGISTAMSAKNGLLIRNRTAFENSRNVTTLIFDKTGTLTEGTFGVTEIKSYSENFKDKDILKIAASIEQNSEHPIASGIIKKANEKKLELHKVDDFSSITGKGVKGNINNNEYYVVSPSYLKENNIKIPGKIASEGYETIVYLLENKNVIGSITIADKIREESFEAIQNLKSNNIKIIMATGDNKETAKLVSQKLQLDDFVAEVLPEDKYNLVKDLQSKGEFVAMTGDGINDAPALAQANIGIAVGSGTDVAAETADIILVNSNPKDIAKIISFGTATYKKMIQNLYWAAGYNIFAVPLAAGILAPIGIILSPAIGAVLMSLSTVIVAVNAQLLKKKV